jgi:hypothetical protein
MTRKMPLAGGEWRQTSTTEFIRLLRCPDCDRLLRAQGGTTTAPTFYCRRCHHSWSWMAPGARRTVLRVVRHAFERQRDVRPLTRWRT